MVPGRDYGQDLESNMELNKFHGLLVIWGNELLPVGNSYWMNLGSCHSFAEIFSNQHSDSAKSVLFSEIVKRSTYIR